MRYWCRVSYNRLICYRMGWTYKLYALMRKPFSWVGAISERYTGIVACSMPTPAPENNLATSQWSQRVAKVSAKML
jgi:hypothetical protein